MYCNGENSKKCKIERVPPLARQVPSSMYTTSEIPLPAKLQTAQQGALQRRTSGGPMLMVVLATVALHNLYEHYVTL